MLPALEIKALHPNALVTATGNGSAIDLNDYDGPVTVALDASAQGTGITTALKLQESADGSTGWTDVAGGALTNVVNAASQQKLLVNSDEMKRYVRLAKTVTGGTGSGYIAASIIGEKKYK